MRDWKSIHSTNTYREMIDLWNQNVESAEFLDGMVGTILSNGVLFNGRESVDGILIRPLEKVDLSGIVQSNTILDNFILYYRDTNNIVEMNKFPIDLLSYANGKPQFLFIKEDLTYRISDYMFGAADEILLARFIINTDSTWNQFYIMAQRAGTPMYNAGDEFYLVDGMYVKSPGGLELSQTSGTVKRSGIDFTDKVSPDIYSFYNLATQRVPLRYINNFNEIDYTQEPTYNIITDKYMIYNMNKKLKVEAEEKMMAIQNMYYGIENFSNDTADELHTAITVGGEYSDLVQIVNAYVDYIDRIYVEIMNLYNLLGNEVLQSVRRADLQNNYNLMDTFLNAYLRNQSSITETQVTAIRNAAAYIVNINLAICSIPIENVFQEIQDGLNDISFDAGTISDVPNGKFTIQRILWDVYEKTLIVQYGDKIYDSFNATIEGTSVLDYPAPFGKTIYIPLAILVLKSGISSINEDPETILIDRRWVVVDQEQTGYADYVARARADKALSQIDGMITGTISVNKADSLKYTNNGNTYYESGDFYLEYTNLRNRLLNVNDLTHSTYSQYDVLSAYQGYLLEQNKLDKSGGTMTGTINSQSIIPDATESYNLGSSSKYWNNAYVKNMYISGDLYKGDSNAVFVYSTGKSVLDVRAMAKSTADSSTFPAGTVVFCWT